MQHQGVDRLATSRTALIAPLLIGLFRRHAAIILYITHYQAKFGRVGGPLQSEAVELVMCNSVRTQA